jgi:hypothetical protein
MGNAGYKAHEIKETQNKYQINIITTIIKMIIQIITIPLAVKK